MRLSNDALHVNYPIRKEKGRVEEFYNSRLITTYEYNPEAYFVLKPHIIVEGSSKILG